MKYPGMAWFLVLVLAAGGCGEDLSDGVPGDEGGRVGYHPDGWSDPASHGARFLSSREVCTRCHGADLAGGGTGVSCEKCHPGWQSNCVFCHGGTDNATGAPPEGVFGQGSRTERPVGAHTAHVTDGAAHEAFDCSVCHVRPATALDDGHLDATPGAEVQFGPPNGSEARFDGATATCTGLYCHGDGRSPSGAVSWTREGGFGCDGCHGDETAADRLSGRHESHLRRGQRCADCHGDVVSTDKAIVDKARHINGVPDVRLVVGTFDAGDGSCTDTCHGGTRSWGGGGGGVHPAGWAAPDRHGANFLTDPGSCRGCHGEDLTGGGAGVSCENCHQGWKSNCVFCHGGTDNALGSPPRSVAGATERGNPAVGAHTPHVTEAGSHVAYDCTTCHVRPATALDDGHLDATPGAEVRFGAPNRDSARYDRDTRNCVDLYCHGDGRSPSGAVSWTREGGFGCDGCHGDAGSSWRLSGAHRKHVEENGVSCSRCHSRVVEGNLGNLRFLDRSLHVNGQRDVALSRGSFDPGTGECTGVCHGPGNWRGGD